MSSRLNYVDCPTHQLDLFKPAGIQTQILGYRDVKFLPMSVIQDNAPITFHLPASPHYMDLSKTYFKSVVEIVGTNGASLKGTSFTDDSDKPKLKKVGVINYLGQTLWQQIDFRINDTTINPSNGFYAYQSYVEALLSYTDAQVETQLSGLEMFQKDTGDITASFPTSANKNQGLIKRSVQFENGKRVTLYTQPHINLCHQDHYLLDGCKVDIRLQPNPDQFVLMSESDVADYHLKIHSCELVVRYVDIHPSTLVAQAQLLNSGVTAKYPVRHVKMMTELLPSHTQVKEIDNVFMGDVPNRMGCFMVANRDQAGRMSKNPFHFRHNSISKMTVRVDGQPVSPGVLTIDGDAKDAYFQLLRASGKFKRIESSVIELDDFLEGYAIFLYDLTPRGQCEDEQFTIRKKGNVHIDLEFKSALSETNTLFVFGEFDGVIEVDRDRNVFLDFY